MRVEHTFLMAALLLGTVACSGGTDQAHNQPDTSALAAPSMATDSVAELSMEKPELAARAEVTDQAARASALAQVPGGRIVAAELEEEDGLLIYSYDVKVTGREGVEEVHVDAKTGKVVMLEHEESDEEG